MQKENQMCRHLKMSHLDFGRVLPSSPKQAQPTQQDVGVGTETDGLHRVGRVTPTTTVTCNNEQGEPSGYYGIFLSSSLRIGAAGGLKPLFYQVIYFRTSSHLQT